MFGTIRRHQKWLWIVISTVTIISFVAFFSPNRRRQGGWFEPHDVVGSINGKSITRDQYANAYREARLFYLINYGDFPGADAMGRQGSMIERATRERLFLVEKLKELDIQVSESAMALWIIDSFRERGDKSFRKEVYDNFIKNVLPRGGLTQQDFERFARHEVGIQHLVSLAGTAGKLIAPQEAATLYHRENDEIEAETVFVSSSNYLAQVVADPAAIATYYTNQQSNYRIPEKTQISYVRFAASNYLAEADLVLGKNTNFNQAVELTLQQRGTNAFKDANNLPLTTEAAKAKIREELRQREALLEAKKKAVDFANELFELKEKTDGLEKLAASKGLVSEVTEPLTQFENPKNLRVPSTFAQAMGKLTPEEPIAEQLIQGEDAIFIISLKKKFPSEIPPLDNVREKVTEDFRNSRALEMARAAGRDLHAALTNGLAAGKTFQTVVAEKSASAVILPPFARKATTIQGIPNRADVSQLVRTAFALSPGKLSDFVPTGTGGFVLYVKTLVPVDDARMKKELAEFTKKLEESRQSEAFRQWFEKQFETAHVNLPGEKNRSGVN